jgi:predicted AlkP superfamily phosphohydrolase/phosphomutase
VQPRVFALWLDGAEPTLLEQLMQEGRMPVLARLRRRGAYGRLQTIDHSFVEATAAMVTTGCLPEQTGCWNMQRFYPRTYELSGTAVYDHREYPPFFALGEGYRVTAFDVPFMPIHAGVHGMQVTGWGSNSHDMPLASAPPDVGHEIVDRFGEHPARGGTAYAMLEDPPSIRDLYERLIRGLRLRERATRELMGKQPWDLFFTAINESDSGHYLWPHTGCRRAFEACGGEHFLRELYVEMDAVIGRLAAVLGDSVRIVIFSAEGMRQNSDDLASMVFLPELLFRYSFPGQSAMNFDPTSLTPSPESLAGIRDWVMELWNYRRRTGRLAGKLRQWLPPRWAVLAERLLGIPPSLFHPLTDNHFLNHQPLRWYRPYWPAMKAFALPTSSHGLVRLNVAGREKHGQVKPADYEQSCAEISSLLMELRNPETGEKAVEEVQRIRRAPHDAPGNAKSQLADLVVKWHPSLGNCCESPTLGMFGPVPYVRTGTHTRDGFLLAVGPGIPCGADFAVGSPIDIATTILRLLDARAPAGLRGRALIEPDRKPPFRARQGVATLSIAGPDRPTLAPPVSNFASHHLSTERECRTK